MGVAASAEMLVQRESQIVLVLVLESVHCPTPEESVCRLEGSRFGVSHRELATFLIALLRPKRTLNRRLPGTTQRAATHRQKANQQPSLTEALGTRPFFARAILGQRFGSAGEPAVEHAFVVREFEDRSTKRDATSGFNFNKGHYADKSR